MSRGLLADLHVDGRVHAHVEAGSGEVVAIIGPNGAGKTTMLRALAGLVEVEGTALLDGVDLLQVPVRERRVGLVFQDQLLFPHLSALENVAFGPRSRGVPRHTARSHAREWLDRMGIGDLADRRPDQLSGGQAQRVAIARALVTEPRMLLLDEPFAGLDVGVAATLRHELAQHLADFDGVTLIVTHDPVDALTLADQLVVLDQSAVVQTGPPAEVAARPRSDHVARLVGLNLVRHEGWMLAFRPEAVAVSLAPPEGSPRLRWHGPITGLTTHGDAVRIHVAGPPALLADVTAAAVADLGLRPGLEVWLAVKATAVERYEAADSMRP